MSIPHINHIENDSSSAGIEIQRLRLAIFFPVVSQNASSSTFHVLMFLLMATCPFPALLGFLLPQLIRR
jgi:hypothetical protein